jgi:hypothetical protein
MIAELPTTTIRERHSILSEPALLAQLVEHFHGKEGVIGSSPIEGFSAIRW